MSTDWYPNSIQLPFHGSDLGRQYAIAAGGSSSIASAIQNQVGGEQQPVPYSDLSLHPDGHNRYLQVPGMAAILPSQQSYDGCAVPHAVRMIPDGCEPSSATRGTIAPAKARKVIKFKRKGQVASPRTTCDSELSKLDAETRNFPSQDRWITRILGQLPLPHPDISEQDRSHFPVSSQASSSAYPARVNSAGPASVDAGAISTKAAKDERHWQSKAEHVPAEAQLQQLQAVNDARAKEVQRLKEELAQSQDRIRSLQGEASSAQQDLAQLRESMASLRQAYEGVEVENRRLKSGGGAKRKHSDACGANAGTQAGQNAKSAKFHHGATAGLGQGRDGAANSFLAPFEARLGLGKACLNTIADPSQVKAQQDVGKKKWDIFFASVRTFDNSLKKGQDLDAGLLGVHRGLLGSVMRMMEAANLFELGMRCETKSKEKHVLRQCAEQRKEHISDARAKLKDGQKDMLAIENALRKLGTGVYALKAAGECLQKSPDFDQRHLAVKSGRVLLERLQTLSELQHLAYEKGSLEQTTSHSRQKHAELTRMGEAPKQLSPASETSCLDAMPTATLTTARNDPKPVSHSRSFGADAAAGEQPSLRKNPLFILADQLDKASARLVITVEAVMKVTSNAPVLRQNLTDYMNLCERVEGEALRNRALAVGWGIAACSAEFGHDIRSNAGALQKTCDLYKSLVDPGGFLEQAETRPSGR